ncbi:hypothetical protein CERZMDRAFT_100423 [Cercospora zeae-maydis SCOH1-5]|uniref:BTB domain-containing protein n=1 Tax=Cercospora zeae-maydis SCOH1-5 TaxID=717836 RepID=A0A6A6F829_9PEZI|nr:hypothetical protein CERZMDRAFT_100423 [Cercospora zeae-maydis SCOH1-5]
MTSLDHPTCAFFVQATDKMAEVQQLAPNGDVKLICSSAATEWSTEIIVSSVVLSLASPVFKVMLGPHFKEGATLASGEKLELPLPDDDAQAMLTICQVIHMRAVSCSPPTAKQLLNIALLADKYDCRLALSYAMGEWIQIARVTFSNQDRLDLFKVAYLMEYPKDFAEFGRLLVLNSPPKFHMTAPESIDDRLRRTIDKLSAHRDLTASIAARELSRTIDEECTETSAGFCLPNCTYLPTRLRNFMTSLSKSQIWPLIHFQDKSLQAMRAALKTFPQGYTTGLEYCDSKMCCQGDSLRPEHDMQLCVKHIVYKLEQSVPEPCLICVKEGHVETSVESGGCKGEHKRNA